MVENWQTRLNYSPVARGILLGGIFGGIALAGSTYLLSQGEKFPYVIKNTFADVFGQTAQVEIGLLLALAATKDMPEAKVGVLGAAYKMAAVGTAFGGNLLWEAGQEILQKAQLIKEGYDPIDYAAYLVGLTIFLGYELAAKFAYYSGITTPVYRLLAPLGLQDRRVIGSDWSLR